MSEPQKPPQMRRHPGVDIHIRLEELPRISIIADSPQDYERIRLFLERSDEIAQLYQLAWHLSAERRAAS